MPLYTAIEDIDRMDAAADGGTVTVPIVTIYHERDDGKIDDYRVYGDVAPVFA